MKAKATQKAAAPASPRFVWWGMYLGQVRHHFSDGRLAAWFHDKVGGPGYVLTLQPGEWEAAT